MKALVLSWSLLFVVVVGQLAAQPANDNWAHASVIETIPARLFGSSAGTTFEAGEPLPAGSQAEGTLWWRWTPNATNAVAVFAVRDAVGGRESVGRVDVYRGPALGGLFPLWRQPDDDTPLVFTGFPGDTYYFQLRVKPGRSGKFWLQLETKPTNDSFAQRTPLVGTHATVDTVNSLATFETGEKIADPTALRRTVWYRWKAPGTGQLLVVGRAINWAPVLGLGTGSSLASLNWLVPSEADVLSHSLFARRYLVTAGTDYNVAFDGSRYASDPALPATDHHGLATLDLHFSSLHFANLTNETRLRQNDSFTVQMRSRHPELDGVASELVLKGASELGESVFSVRVPVTAMAVSMPTLAPGTYLLFAEGRNQSGEYLETPAVKIRIFPVNDRFADRLTVAPDGERREAPLLNSTREAGEPANGIGQTVGSVWWTFVAPTSGQYLLDVQGAPMAVYTGSVPAQLTTVLPPLTSTGFFPVIAGRTYHLAAFAVERAPGEGLPARFKLFAPGENDNWGAVQSVELPIGESSFHSHDHASSFSLDEPESVRSRGAGSVWWNFTVPRDGMLVLRAFREANSPISLVLFAKSTDSNLGEPVAWDQGFTGELYARLSRGEVYSLAIIRSDQSAGGPFTLSANFTPSPDNDRYDRRIRLQGNSLDISAEVRGATLDPDEPPFAYGSVWWEWSAPQSGLLRLSSTTNAYLHAYRIGEPGTSLVELPTIAGGALGIGLREVLVTNGQTVAIRLGHSPDTTNEVPLRLTFQPVPEATNDRFANRARLPELGGSVNLPAAFSTPEPGEPIFWGVAEGVAPGSVWFEWTATRSARVRLRVSSPATMRVFRAEQGQLSPGGLVAVSDFRTAVLGDVEVGTTICVAVYRPHPVTAQLDLDWIIGSTNRISEVPGDLFPKGTVRLESSGSPRPGAGGPQPFWSETETLHHWISDSYGDVSVRQTKGASALLATVYQESQNRAPVAEGGQFTFSVSPGQHTWFRMSGNAATEPGAFELTFIPVNLKFGYQAGTNGSGTVWVRGPVARRVGVESSTGFTFWAPVGSITLSDESAVGLNVRMDTTAKYYRFRLKP